MAGNPPSITDWIGSIGTAAAFLAASIGYGYDRLLRRRTERIAQARLVDAWLASEWNPLVGETEVRSLAGEGEITREMRSTLTFSGFISNQPTDNSRCSSRYQANSGAWLGAAV